MIDYIITTSFFLLHHLLQAVIIHFRSFTDMCIHEQHVLLFVLTCCTYKWFILSKQKHNDYVKVLIYYNKRSDACYIPFLAAYNPKSHTLGL